MHDPGMIRLRRLQPFEYACGFQLAGICLVVQIDGFEQGERIEHGRLGVGGITVVEAGHGGGVAIGPRLLVDGGVSLEERRQRLNPVALPLGPRIRRAGPLYCLPALLEQLRRERRRQGIGPLADGDSPIRHRTRRLTVGDGAKRLFGFRIEERVQHGDGAIELGLRRRAARGLEVNAAEGAAACVIVVLRRRAPLAVRNQRQGDEKDRAGVLRTVRSSHISDLAPENSMLPLVLGLQ